jgi:hypothetical protein
VHAGQLARRAGPRRAGTARGRGDGDGTHGTHDGLRVSLIVTAYGRQVGVGPARRAGATPTGDVARGARSSVPAHNRFGVPHFDRFKLKNFELKFKIAKYESCGTVNPIQLSLRPTGQFLNGLGDNPLQSYRFVGIGQTVQQGFD